MHDPVRTARNAEPNPRLPAWSPSAAGDGSRVYFASPDEIATNPELTLAERLRLLGDWAQDLVDRQIASAEGMTAAAPGVAAAEAQLLHDVNVAIDMVEAKGEQQPGVLARTWRRLTSR